jgi:hypothetical protein
MRFTGSSNFRRSSPVLLLNTLIREIPVAALFENTMPHLWKKEVFDAFNGCWRRPEWETTIQ